ncbi:tripartite tricarboxylate transporter substrate binding protein [Ramlibacter sp. MAHUQ-53]|uniref:tripartite tricarboxylate transporter substrate binding protein n=1 Tax=unclassified Ramlibacter TaxID=2617605 RepID=UPI0036322AB2
MKRRSFAAAALLGLALSAQAQSDSPLTLVVPFPPGDALDATARAVAEAASQELKVPIVVDNKPGAAGFIAADAVARSNSQTTFLLGTTAMMSITPFVRKAPYAPSDFTPVARIATINLVVAVSSGFPAKTWAEFVALARQNPGKYSYASPGEGTLLHMGMEALQSTAGFKLLHVPYKGMGPALQDFLAGRIDVYSEPANIAHVKAGTARALAVVGDARLPDLPEVPTTRDLKIAYDQAGWFGIFAPKNVPPALTARLSTALRNAAARPELRTRLPAGVQSAYLAGAPFADQIRGEQDLYRKLITDLNIKLD